MRKQTLAAIDRLALNPGPVAAVMRCDGSDPDQLIEVLASCPVLTGRVIGVANSAGSSALHRMDTIDRCVRHLGAKQTRTIALTMAMQQLTQDLDVEDELLHALWAGSATKAVAAQLVAQVVSPEHAQAAYGFGLLQDIALPVLLALDPVFFANKLAGSDGRQPWTRLEREHFGIDHTELGALLLKKWYAPDSIVRLVQNHHDELDDDDMAWLAEMPTRVAGLLPHLDEATHKKQRQTLAAAHTRFLAERYDSVEALMKETAKRVKQLGKAAGGTPRVGPEFVQQVVQTVAQDTFALAAQVSRLDQQLGQQLDALAHSQEDALSDTLTGLMNRRGFESVGRQMLAHASKSGQAAACLVIDLDDFKPINDEFGHDAGDKMLKAAADMLKANVSSGDLVARLGGDEFAILILGDAQGDARSVAERLHAICNGRSINVGSGNMAKLAMSIGGAFLDRVSKDTGIDALINAADKVMYSIKHGGKRGVSFEAFKHKAA